MENIVIAEFEKQKASVTEMLRKKYKLGDEDIEHIHKVLKTSLGNIIHLAREGKSAHEKFFSDIIVNSIDAIVGYDNQSRIFLWNKGAERIFGYSKSEIMNKDFSVLIPDYLLEKGEKEFLISEVIQKGYIENYETERKTKKNEIINVSMSRFAIYDGQSEMIASVGIIRDLTKIKTLEKELQERERLALIGEVVASIAHTLSNPLNIISGNADYLLLEKKSTDSEYEELKTILDETTRITKSIRHLLNFSRPLKVNKSFNDLNKLVGKVISNSKYLKDKKKIVFEKILDKDLPEFEFDISEIEEVFNNLITNAIQAIPSKGKIKITTEKTGTEIIITITDSGRGIPKENLSKIFQPFFSSKEYGKGTGLGLSLSKQIIRGHGGDINVKSTVGKGSTFIINLPYNGNKINQV